jgi:hypothetical protein
MTDKPGKCPICNYNELSRGSRTCGSPECEDAAFHLDKAEKTKPGEDCRAAAILARKKVAIAKAAAREEVPVGVGGIGNSPRHNDESARDALAVLREFARLLNQEDEDYETLFVDLVADLMHLADATELRFDEILRVAKNHHRCEIEEEGKARAIRI